MRLVVSSRRRGQVPRLRPHRACYQHVPGQCGVACVVFLALSALSWGPGIAADFHGKNLNKSTAHLGHTSVRHVRQIPAAPCVLLKMMFSLKRKHHFQGLKVCHGACLWESSKPGSSTSSAQATHFAASGCTLVTWLATARHVSPFRRRRRRGSQGGSDGWVSIADASRNPTLWSWQRWTSLDREGF